MTTASAPVTDRAVPARALRAWLIAALVYLTAVFHRTSLGVAGLLAAQRFGISAGQLSVFVFVQIGVYAAMQIPTGILVDRFGPRRLLLVAAGLMTVAQLMFAAIDSYPAALAARAVLGCGDALTFVSVLRFAANSFPPNRYPLVVSLTAMAGQVGNVAATVPLALLLHSAGWFPTFGVAGLVSLGTLGLVVVLVPGAPVRPLPRSAAALRAPLRRVGRSVRDAWALPATRAGFWVHFSCMTSTTVFGVLWGVPYLVKGEGFTSAAASRVLLVIVLVAAVASPLTGVLIARHPAWRIPIAMTVSSLAIAGWLALIVGFDGRPPHALLYLQAVIMALGGPASMIGFALARDYNRPAVVGTATGVVNVGGFTATVAGAVGVGWVLDASGATDAAAFRWAWLLVVLLQAAGTVQVVRWWRRTRASVLLAQHRGDAVPVPVVRRKFDLAVELPM